MSTIIILDYRVGKTYLIPFNSELDVPDEEDVSEAIESLIENKGLSINDCHYMLVDTLTFEIL